MEVHASLKHLRMAPRKVRLVINAVRGLDIAKADTLLSFMKKDAALPVLKLLRSAVANATHNAHLAKEGLYIKTITADGGPVLKRFRPRAFGRAAGIRKRSTHINIVLDQRASAATVPAGKKLAKKSALKKSPKKAETASS